MIYGVEVARVVGRIFVFFVSWLGIWIAIAWPLFKKYHWRPFHPTDASQKLILLLPLYMTAPLIIGSANWLMHQSWASLGLVWSTHTVRSLAIGCGIAVSGLCLILLCKRSMQLISFSIAPDLFGSARAGGQTALAVGGLLLLALWIGGIEELVFRGWLQTQLATTFTPFLAATVSSGLFAIAHLIWDGRSGLRQQPGLFLLGWVLVIARWVDGDQLALAWGLHAGWVWGLACVGEFIKPQPIDTKPKWLTGFAAQPLTDVFDFALMAITAALIWRIFTY